MKLLIVLSVIACGYAAKLDRTYLPPASASSAGGSPGSLNTPLGPSGFGQPAGFGQPGKTSPAFRGQQSGNNGFSAPSNQYGSPSSPNQPGQAVSPNFDAGFGAPAQSFGNQAQDYQRSQPPRAQASADQNAEILRSDSQNDGETFNYNFETSNGISAEESGVATNGVQAQGQFAYSSDDGQSFRVQYTADENGYLPQGDHLPTSPPIPDEILKSIEKNAEAAAAGTQEGAYNPDEDTNDSSYQQYNNNAASSYNQVPTGQSSSQGQGSPAQLYGAPNAGSRPQGGFQGSQRPSQYNTAANGAARPSSFNQPQAQSPQYYGAAKPNSFGHQPAQQFSESTTDAKPNGFSQQGQQQYSAPSSNNFASSGPKPQQYQSSSSGPYPSGRPQGSVQPQDASGYQYNKPQEGSPAQQYRPQNGGLSPQGPRPIGNSAPSSPSYQGSFGGNNNAQAYGAAPSFATQGSYTPASGPSGSKGVFRPARPDSDIPSGNQPSSNGFNRPQGGQAFRPQGPAAKTMSFAGYQYNKPAGNNQFGSSPQNGKTQFGSSAQNGNSPFGGSQSGSQGRPGQFGAPRAPPSFSEEEGYKY